MKRISRIAAAFAMAAVLDSPPAMGAASKSPVCAACVKATMLKLAGLGVIVGRLPQRSGRPQVTDDLQRQADPD